MKLIKNLYFVAKGERTGQFLIIIDFDKKTNVYSVLVLPDSEAILITQTEIENGINKKILEFVQELPETIFSDCKTEFKYRETHK
jgi:hypothetical protein